MNNDNLKGIDGGQMENERPRPNRVRRKRSAGARFARALLITVAVLLFLCSAGFMVWAKLMGRDADLRSIAEAIGSNLKDGGSVLGAFSGVPEHTNFLILGTDAGLTRTDTMIAGTFNKEDKTITLLSIPRDTYVIMPQERRDILKAHDVWPPAPSSGVMKINAAHHYAGEKYGVEFAVKQVEDLLGVKIEYYMKMDLEAFRFIVDEIGGVEFDVPMRMYYRDIPENLYIDLYPGLQTLSGEQAEGLVRYRQPDKQNPISGGYKNGASREGTQQAFLKALISQLLAKENIVGNAPAMLTTFLKYVQTNFNPADLPKYLGEVKGLDSSKIITYTLPGKDQYIGDVSYFLHDEVAAAELVQEIFYGASTTREPESSVGKSIQVLNGGVVSGLAARTRDDLAEVGFTVSTIGDYSGTKVAATRIVVKRASLGADLQALFPGSTLEVNPSGTNGYDIVVILGTDAE